MKISQHVSVTSVKWIKDGDLLPKTFKKKKNTYIMECSGTQEYVQTNNFFLYILSTTPNTRQDLNTQYIGILCQNQMLTLHLFQDWIQRGGPKPEIREIQLSILIKLNNVYHCQYTYLYLNVSNIVCLWVRPS